MPPGPCFLRLTIYFACAKTAPDSRSSTFLQRGFPNPHLLGVCWRIHFFPWASRRPRPAPGAGPWTPFSPRASGGSSCQRGTSSERRWSFRKHLRERSLRSTRATNQRGRPLWTSLAPRPSGRALRYRSLHGSDRAFVLTPDRRIAAQASSPHAGQAIPFRHPPAPTVLRSTHAQHRRQNGRLRHSRPGAERPAHPQCSPPSTIPRGLRQ